MFGPEINIDEMLKRSSSAGTWTVPASYFSVGTIRAGDRIWYRLKRDDKEGSFYVHTATVKVARAKVLQVLGEGRSFPAWIDRSTIVIVDHEPAPEPTDAEG